MEADLGEAIFGLELNKEVGVSALNSYDCDAWLFGQAIDWPIVQPMISPDDQNGWGDFVLHRT